MAEIGIGMLGSGFIGEFHADGLRYVRDARVVANWGAGSERRTAFATRFGSRALDSIDAVCADPDVDLVVVSLPNHLHLEAVRSAASHGKAVACTKPLGRNGDEAAEMLRLVTEAGVFHAYLENVVFNAEMIRMREIVESGAIGRLTTFRAREGHSGPHAAHFWDAELAGGGAILDMASHGAEAARAMFGKDLAVRDVFAWGDTLVHGGRIVQDIISSPLRAFIERPAGYLGEKVDADTGWVYPVPNETYAHGHDAMMADVVNALRDGRAPQETFEDGLIVNRILDAAYRSIRSGRWESLEQPAATPA